MKRKTVWWWAVPVVAVLGGLGYYWYSHSGQEAEQVLLAGDLSPVDSKGATRNLPATGKAEKGPTMVGVSPKEDIQAKSFPIDEKAPAGRASGPEGVPVDKETLLQELRTATEDRIERLSELDRKDFAAIDRRVRHALESGHPQTGQILEHGQTPEQGRALQSGRDLSKAPGGERSPGSVQHQELSAETGGPAARLFEPQKNDLFKKAPADRVYCELIDEYIADFFAYLDTRDYIKRLNLGRDTYSYFKGIVKALSARPPVPGGEGFAPAVMVKNIFFFSRALDRKDLRFFKEVVRNEQDTLEINLEMFYRWLMLGKLRSGTEEPGISFDVIYRYAGFLLNTTGGRAYLYRRPVSLRLLLTYYSVLVVYQADRAGRNSYGINIVPYIRPLRREISHYPDFEFQDQYMSALTRIEDYYQQNR